MFNLINQNFLFDDPLFPFDNLLYPLNDLLYCFDGSLSAFDGLLSFLMLLCPPSMSSLSLFDGLLSAFDGSLSVFDDLLSRNFIHRTDTTLLPGSASNRPVGSTGFAVKN